MPKKQIDFTMLHIIHVTVLGSNLITSTCLFLEVLNPREPRFLDVALDMRKFRLPKDIVEYDQWLDKQAEELHKQQAMKHGQGLGRLLQT